MAEAENNGAMWCSLLCPWERCHTAEAERQSREMEEAIAAEEANGDHRITSHLCIAMPNYA